MQLILNAKPDPAVTDIVLITSLPALLHGLR